MKFKNKISNGTGKGKTSWLAIFAFIMSFFSIFFVAGIFAIILGVWAILHIRKSEGQLRGKGLAISGIAISVISICLVNVWCLDAPEIKNDYTMADIHNADANYSGTFEILMLLGENDGSKIGLTKEDKKRLKELSCSIEQQENFAKIADLLNSNSSVINQAWQNAKAGRDIIDQLAQYTQIADREDSITDPNFSLAEGMISLYRLYSCYIPLQIEQKNMASIKELIKFDSVLRKYNVNSRLISTKTACDLALTGNIITANYILNNPKTSNEALELLEEHFVPFTTDQISIRMPLILEYIQLRDQINEMYSENFKNNSLLKKNSTIAIFRNKIDTQLNGSEIDTGVTNPLSVWPAAYSNLVSQIDHQQFSKYTEVPFIYKCYNPVGTFFIKIFLRDQEFQKKIVQRCQIYDDLLQIVLKKRLGKDVGVKGSTGEEYIIDIENKKIISPGPDKKFHTEDDVKLLINPEIF